MARFGFNDTPAALQANTQWLHTLRCDCVRVGISAEPDPAGLWGADQIVNWARAQSLRPFISIGGWNPAPDPVMYAEWVGGWVRHYGTSVHYGLWNEPNFQNADQPNPLSVDQAIELNLAGARAAKNVNSDAKVLGSPVGPTGDWESYMQALYGELPDFVEVALHIYPGGRYEGRLDKLRAAYDFAASFGPVHVTELDMAAPWLSDDASKPQLAAKAYDLLDRRGARTIIYHSIADHKAEGEALAKARRGTNVSV